MGILTMLSRITCLQTDALTSAITRKADVFLLMSDQVSPQSQIWSELVVKDKFLYQ